jgi:hypothetical protein
LEILLVLALHLGYVFDLGNASRTGLFACPWVEAPSIYFADLGHPEMVQSFCPGVRVWLNNGIESLV